MSSKISDTLSIRPMQADDLIQAEALDRLAFSDPWPAGAYIYEYENAQNSILLVAVDSSQPAGQELVAAAVLWLVVDEVRVATIAVMPQYQGKGLGLKLLATGLAQAARRGAVRSHLEVRAGNAAALRLYYGLGYQTVGLRPGYYKDNHEDALLLTLEGLNAEKLDAIAAEA